MELKELVGKHKLTAVEPDADTEKMENALLFTMDGKTYRIAEDEDDGYRSHAKEIEVVDRKLSNRFKPCAVVGHHVESSSDYSGECDILELVDVTTGKIVLAIGTANTDDYYPYYVADFHPEAMAINKRRS